jgi:hypothetical protein
MNAMNADGQAPAFLAPVEVPLPLGELSLVVRPANVGQIARLLTVAAPVVGSLMALPPGFIDRLAGDEPTTADDVAELFELLSRHPHKLIELVAIATGQDVATVAALPPDKFAYLFAVVVQVNADFFVRATPVFAAAGRVLRAAADKGPQTAGPAPATT